MYGVAQVALAHIHVKYALMLTGILARTYLCHIIGQIRLQEFQYLWAHHSVSKVHRTGNNTKVMQNYLKTRKMSNSAPFLFDPLCPYDLQ